MTDQSKCADSPSDHFAYMETTHQNIMYCLRRYECCTMGSIYMMSDVTNLKLCDRLFKAIRERMSSTQVHLLALEARDYIWEALHSKGWDRVDIGCRDVFGLVSLVAALTCVHEERSEKINSAVDFSEAKQIALADYGILLGSELYRHDLQQLISSVAERNKRKEVTIPLLNDATDFSITEPLQYSSSSTCKAVAEIADSAGSRGIYKSQNHIQHHQMQKQKQPVFLSAKKYKSGRATPIARENSPDLLHFYEKCLLSSTPTVLTGCMENWPALEKWRDLEYYTKGACVHIYPTFWRER